MVNHTLGTLTRVELRNAWSKEDTDFTPWLAEAENIAALGEALRLNLETTEIEKYVGPFRADILAKDVDSDSWVLIENQLERTDHKHLGQLMTYAAGLDVVTVIWVAAEFQEDHRAAIDWLNKITHNDFKFFGVEIELWRIADSPVAPKFNIVCEPNDWTRQQALSRRSSDDGEMTETQRLYAEYWTGLNEAMIAFGGPVQGTRKALPRNVIDYSTGVGRMSVRGRIDLSGRAIGASIYLRGFDAKDRFAPLQKISDQIEEELGYQLEWREASQDCIVEVLLSDVDPADRGDWQRQHDWLSKRINELRNMFVRHVRT